VILISQIYHVRAESHLLPLIWGALCLPVALLLRFTPALYLTSGLWLWSYWLYGGSHGELPWYYPALLLGLLIPYSLYVKDQRLYLTHVAVLMVALASTVPTGSLWLASVWVLALVALHLKLKKPLYDWLLLAGFLLWQVTFLVKLEDLPNVFYALPVAYLFVRGVRQRSNALLVANAVNTSLWLASLLLQVNFRYEEADVSATGFLLWLLAAGLLSFGVGCRIGAGVGASCCSSASPRSS